MRVLARVVAVDGIRPIDKADAIEIAEIGGWQVVVKKGEFEKGALGVYFEIDSALPFEDERYAFLRDRCLKQWKNGDEVIKKVLRIRTIRLRGELSQGLLLPISQFPEAKREIGYDLTSKLKVEHIDELDERMRSEIGIRGNSLRQSLPKWVPDGVVSVLDAINNKWKHLKWAVYSRLFPRQARLRLDRGNFPSQIPKTDEPRVQNLKHFWQTCQHTEWEVTEKADGSSMTVAYSPSCKPIKPFIICSRNMYKGDGTDNDDHFCTTARACKLDQTLPEYCIRNNTELAIQGELVGPKVNGNRDKFEDFEFHVFRIFNLKEKRWLKPRDRYDVCAALGLKHVRVLNEALRVFEVYPTVETLLKFAEGKTERGNEREGIVCKSVDGVVSFKVVSNKYLLMLEKKAED